MKEPASSLAANRDSISTANDSSPPHSDLMNVARTSAGCSAAAKKIDLIRAHRSASMLISVSGTGCHLTQLAKQPRFRQRPLAFDCRRRNANYFRRLFYREPAKELGFDDSALLRVEGRQFFQRLVQRKQIEPALLSGQVAHVGQIKLIVAAPSLRRVSRARALDQYASHGCRGDAEELRPVLPGNPALVDQSNISLVYQGGRLECVVRALAAKIAFGDPMKLIVNHRHQAAQ